MTYNVFGETLNLAQPIHDELEYRKIDRRRNDSDDGSRSCRNFASFGPATPDITTSDCVIFVTNPWKIVNILNIVVVLRGSDRKLTQLLRESLGGSTCKTCCAIIHLSPSPLAYNDTLHVLQLASRMHQTRLRRRSKVSPHVQLLHLSVDYTHTEPFYCSSGICPGPPR